MTSTIAPPTDKEIRQAIKGVIVDKLEALYGTPLYIRVHDYWVLGFSIGDSAALITISDGPETGKVHAWMIGLSGISRKRPETEATPQNVSRYKKVGPNRRDTIKSYRIWCFYNLFTGDSDNNSENKIAAEIEEVADALSLSPVLGLNNPWVMGHDEIQFSLIDTFSAGQKKMNIAQGTLNILINRPLDLVQH